MYFLTACLIVVVLSAVVAYRRAGSLPRNLQGRLDRQERLAAMWPLFCAGICAMGLFGFKFLQRRQELGLSQRTISSYLLSLSLAAGFLASLAGWTDRFWPIATYCAAAQTLSLLRQSGLHILADGLWVHGLLGEQPSHVAQR